MRARFGALEKPKPTVPAEGLEPPRPKAVDLKSTASANFAMPAFRQPSWLTLKYSTFDKFCQEVYNNVSTLIISLETFQNKIKTLPPIQSGLRRTRETKMKQVLLSILVISLFSCGSLHRAGAPRETNNVSSEDERIPLTPPDRVLPEDEDFNSLLPYDDEVEPSAESSKEPHDFNELYRLIPISFGADRPESEDLQRCVELTLVYVVEDSGSTRASTYTFFVSFEDATSARIDEQTRSELSRFHSLVARRPQSLIELRVPEGVRDQVLARRRIQVVREELIMAGVPRDRIVEGQDSPPE